MGGDDLAGQCAEKPCPRALVTEDGRNYMDI